MTWQIFVASASEILMQAMFAGLLLISPSSH